MYLISILYLEFLPFLSLAAGGEAGGGEGAGEGGGGAGAPSNPCGQGGMNLFIMLGLMFAVFYFLIIRPERRKQQARQAMVQSVKKGDKVVTTAGIVGKIMKVEDHEVTIQVDRDNDVRIRFLKSAIHEVMSNGGSPDKK